MVISTGGMQGQEDAIGVRRIRRHARTGHLTRQKCGHQGPTAVRRLAAYRGNIEINLTRSYYSQEMPPCPTIKCDFEATALWRGLQQALSRDERLRLRDAVGLVGCPDASGPRPANPKTDEQIGTIGPKLSANPHFFDQNWQRARHRIAVMFEHDGQSAFLKLQTVPQLLQHFSRRLVEQHQVHFIERIRRFGEDVLGQLWNGVDRKTHQAGPIHVQTARPTFSVPRLDRVLRVSCAAVPNNQGVCTASISAKTKPREMRLVGSLNQGRCRRISKYGSQTSIIWINIF